jgi:hypothetical protein
MARSKKPPARKPKPAPVARINPEVERTLDRIDEALLGGDQTQVPALVEQLWRARRSLPEILTQRVITGRARIPAFAFDLLGGFAGAQAPKYLRRIAATTHLPDIVRWGARRRAGWPERGQAKRRLDFLTTLQNADETLVVAVDQGTHAWPPDNEILEEVLEYLLVLPSERRQAVTTRIAAAIGIRAGLLLHAVLHIDDPATQRLALTELPRLRDPGAAGPIARLARTARDAGIRAEAEAASRRLRLRPVEDAAAVQPLTLPPVEAVTITSIDGDGGQVVIVVRRLAEGVFAMVDVLYKDNWGIKDSFGASRASVDRAEFIIESLEMEDIATVDSDLAGARGVIALAIEDNAATGHPIPPAFELWEPLLHETYPPADDEPVATTELDDTPFAGRQDLVRASGALADHPFFESWGFERADIVLALFTTPPPGRSGRLGDRQYKPLIEHLVTPEVRETFRRRLRRQAWLLEQNGDTPARDLALATAAHLATALPADLSRLPFLRALVDRSIAHLYDDFFFPE